MNGPNTQQKGHNWLGALGLVLMGLVIAGAFLAWVGVDVSSISLPNFNFPEINLNFNILTTLIIATIATIITLLFTWIVAKVFDKSAMRFMNRWWQPKNEIYQCSSGEDRLFFGRADKIAAVDSKVKFHIAPILLLLSFLGYSTIQVLPFPNSLLGLIIPFIMIAIGVIWYWVIENDWLNSPINIFTHNVIPASRNKTLNGGLPITPSTHTTSISDILASGDPEDTLGPRFKTNWFWEILQTRWYKRRGVGTLLLVYPNPIKGSDTLVNYPKHIDLRTLIFTANSASKALAQDDSAALSKGHQIKFAKFGEPDFNLAEGTANQMEAWTVYKDQLPPGKLYNLFTGEEVNPPTATQTVPKRIVVRPQ